MIGPMVVALVAGLVTAALGGAVLAAERRVVAERALGRVVGVGEAPSAAGLMKLARPEHLATAGVLLGALGAALVGGSERATAVVVVGVLVVGGVGLRWHGGRRQAAAAPQDLVDLVESVGAHLASGRSLGPAFVNALGESVGDPADHALCTELDAGLPVQEALDGWARRRRGGAGLVADALAVAGTTGGGCRRAVLQVGDTLRERAALDREVAALGAQAILSARVLSIVPVGFASLIVLLDHRVAAFVLATPAGWGCIASGALLDLAGWRWMQRLVRSI